MAVAPAVPQAQPAWATRQPPEDAPVRKPRRTSTGALVLLLAAVVANLLIIAIIVSRGEPATTLPVHAHAVPVARPAPAPPPVLPSSFGEGRFVVGTRHRPGDLPDDRESRPLRLLLGTSQGHQRHERVHHR